MQECRQFRSATDCTRLTNPSTTVQNPGINPINTTATNKSMNEALSFAEKASGNDWLMAGKGTGVSSGATADSMLSPSSFAGQMDKKLSACRYQNDYFPKDRNLYHPASVSAAPFGLDATSYSQQYYPNPGPVAHHHPFPVLPPSFIGNPNSGYAANNNAHSNNNAGECALPTTAMNASMAATQSVARSCGALPSPTIYPPTPPPSAPWIQGHPWFLGDTF